MTLTVIRGEFRGKLYRESEAGKKEQSNPIQEVHGPRQKKTRTEAVEVEEIGTVHVLKDPIDVDTSMGIATRMSALTKTEPSKQIAGRDYDHEDFCLQCWDGGELICCDFCPASFHPQCVESIPNTKAKWSCPHHACDICGIKAAAAGGMLFRCQMCPSAYCEDHLPQSALIVGTCARFESLGAKHPNQASYIFCSDDCVRYAEEQGCEGDVISAGVIKASTGMDLRGSNGVEKAPGIGKIDDRGHREKHQP